MMTVPMDNSSAPIREHVQRLFNKNNELEKGLRKAAQAKIPSDPNAWLQMRENYEAIILEDHDFSELHEIEYGLWQLHYKRIEEFRAHMNSASASAGSVTAHGGKGVARPDRIKKIRSVFKGFLSEATGFYHDLILKIRAKYGLPLGYFSEGPGNQINLGKDEKKSAEMKKGLISCHRCLIYLGDLARYKGLYGEGDSVSRDYAAASSYYIEAASLWPSSGNPHHQLAILASYSGDDLVAVYRYFRSLAVDCPFSTARDNLIIVFEKNRQSYSQLPGDAKINSVKRMNGRGRGRGEIKLPAKDVKTEINPIKGVFSIPEIYKTFCVRFVRLNGILFTRTSLETFGEVFSLVMADLHDLLSSGTEEELNFGSDAAENGLFVVRLIAILIFMVHNVNKESEGQSYAEILQRSVLLQNAFTAAFEFVGHILRRCVQLQDISSSYLLPAILVFIEWLACNPDIATGSDVEVKQATARSFFWTQCISFLNKLILSGLVSVDGDEGETCFSDMSRYEEGETGNRLALWEDFELRGFLPLLPAQLILDFSRKLSFGSDGSNKDRRARMERILAAGRALMSVVRVDQQGIYFDLELKKFAIGVEPKKSEHDMIGASLDISLSTGMKQGMPIEKTRNLGAMQPMEQYYMEGEEEDEVIVFKPTVAEKHTDVSIPKSIAYEVLKPVEDSSKDDWANYAVALSAPQLQVASLSANSQLPFSFANTIPHPIQHVDPSTSKWIVEQQASLDDGLESLSISGNVLAAKAELQQGSHPHAFSLPFSSYENLNSIGILSGQTGFSEAVMPSKYDHIIPSGPTMKLPNVATNSRKSPVSRPVRHFGPPPGFSPVPTKQINDSMAGLVLKNEHPPMDDYSWLDGYKFSSAGGADWNNSLNYMGDVYSHASGNHNISTGMMSFPFPGKQAPAVQAQVEDQKMWSDYQPLEHLKLHKEQQQQQLQVQRGNQQSAPLPELYQGPSLWSGQFFV
ncbi:nonsense-mediated mRNA decay factor SMG7 [Magnolia sinica]|uniref:nonsense-mediated mRNA decay factor SMG7 n=1 Tax=Magnolia sinica TaxID=86752 RepID=UPI0026581EC9|nr:nonsense-mediated mRNA decay factor SMG7 [Magnolia sinica]